MIRLHIKIPFTFRIGEGKRIQHDEVVMACIGGEPGSDVRSDTPMLSLGKPIERQVSFEPVEIRCRGINARARRRATRCRGSVATPV